MVDSKVLELQVQAIASLMKSSLIRVKGTKVMWCGAERASALPDCGVPCFLSLPIGERVSHFFRRNSRQKKHAFRKELGTENTSFIKQKLILF